MQLYATKVHTLVLSEVFTNLSAGYIGLVLITPVSGVIPWNTIKNLILAIIFYFLAAELRKRGEKR